MGKTPVTDPHKAWNVKHFKRLEAYNARLQKLLDNAIGKAAMIAMRHGAEASVHHLFSFADDRQMKAEVDKLMKELSDEMTSFIKSAEEAEWKKAYEQAAAYIGGLYKAVADIKGLEERSAEAFLTMRTRNLDALEAFRKRKIGGLSLSKKVWNYTQDFGRQMEVSIDTALMQGKSAAALSRDIRSLLTDPNALFRRVRDTEDNLRMSKAMEAYHPGTGRYRSAYKNAMRLARTEINMAYRASDCDTAQQSDDCVGIEVHLSNNHNCKGVAKGEFYDICDQLAGRYPKGFNFTGWHPQCRCFITYVLKTDEEHRRDIMTDTNGDSVNTVHDVPDSFKQWVKDNEQRIKASEQKGTLPYFLKDNEKYWKDAESVDGILGKGQAAKVESSIVGKDAAGNAVTHEQWYGTPTAGKKPTENASRIEEYRRYKEDPDYRDVEFNQETGGLKATHVGHSDLSSDKKRYFGLSPNQLENSCQDILFRLGNSAILCEEGIETVSGMFDTSLDLLLNGKRMDISSVTEQKASYRNNLCNKNHQLSKFNNLSYVTEKADSVCLYFHDPAMFSPEKVTKGIEELKKMQYKDKETGELKQHTILIKHIYCVINEGEGKLVVFDVE